MGYCGKVNATRNIHIQGKTSLQRRNRRNSNLLSHEWVIVEKSMSPGTSIFREKLLCKEGTEETPPIYPTNGLLWKIRIPPGDIRAAGSLFVARAGQRNSHKNAGQDVSCPAFLMRVLLVLFLQEKNRLRAATKASPPSGCGSGRGHFGVSVWCEEESCSRVPVAAPVPCA